MFTKNTAQQKESTETILENLINDYISSKLSKISQIKRGKMDKEAFMRDVKAHIESYYHVSAETVQEVLERFGQYVFGYSRLTSLIDALDITDIRCISYDNIRIKENGVRKSSDIKFNSKEEYKKFVEFVATKNQVNITNRNAIQRFTDIDSSPDFILRFTIAMPLVNTYEEPYMCIRKVPKNFPEMDALVKKGMLTNELADELIKRFRTSSTLICGGNSSGKTTILNALKETLPDNMSILVTQQADELTTKFHPDMMFMHSLPGTSESQVSYDLKDISIAGLTMDVDFFIVGEIKGGEAMYLLNAAYTGQKCAATIHAPGADKAIDKCTDYAMYNSRYSKEELMKMMLCFQTIIFMEGFKVSQVYEAVDWNHETKRIEYNIIYDARGAK